MARGTVATRQPVLECPGELTEPSLDFKGQHNLEKGEREAGDTLLYRKRVGFQTFRYVPEIYEHCGDYTITAVVAEDNWSNDTGGDPEIVDGGPGFKHVTVKVTSKISRGFDHTVYVYGKKKD